MFDRFQEFVRNPLEFEWILDEARTCVAKDGDVLFANLFKQLATDVEPLYLRDGNALNLCSKNLMTETYVKQFSWPVEPKTYGQKLVDK